MEKTDPHMTHHYSHDQLAKTIFMMELNSLKLRLADRDNGKSYVEEYLKERVNEIEKRWK